jgi:hypothetical protein
VLRRAIASIHAAMASIIRFSLSETKPRGTLLPPPTLSLQAVMGPEFALAAANLRINLTEGRARLIQVVCEKP